MGRRRIPVGFALLIVLYVSLFAFASNAYGDCPARVANVVVVDAPGWNPPSLIIQSSSGGVVKFTNSNFPLSTAAIVPNGAVVIDRWPDYLSGSGVRVAKLSIEDGVCAKFTTENVYLDGQTVVEIPELPSPLAQNEGGYRFPAIRNIGDRSTFIALISDAPTRAAVSFYDGDNQLIGRKVVDVDGFTWYEAPVTLNIGSALVENIGSGVGGVASGNLSAIAFAGYRDGGSPRVIPPEPVP